MMKVNARQTIVASWPALCVVLVGCASGYEKVQEEFIGYSEAPLEQAERPDRYKLDGKSARVAVADFALPKDQASPDYAWARLGNLKQFAAEIVNSELDKAGASLVSKSDALKIRSYIENAEKHGRSANQNRCDGRRNRACAGADQERGYAGVSDVDYALLGEISAVTYSANTETYRDKNGSSVSCVQKATVAGTIAIYKIPSTIRDTNIRFEADDTDTDLGASCQKGKANKQVIKTAMEKAIGGVKSRFQNLVSTDAFVLNKRVNTAHDSAIFQISGGKNLNLEKGLKMQFMHVDKRNDPVTGQMVDEETMVGQGVVGDKVDGNRAWVYVKKDDDKGIRMWDIARPHHEDCVYQILCGQKKLLP